LFDIVDAHAAAAEDDVEDAKRRERVVEVLAGHAGDAQDQRTGMGTIGGLGWNQRPAGALRKRGDALDLLVETNQAVHLRRVKGNQFQLIPRDRLRLDVQYNAPAAAPFRAEDERQEMFLPAGVLEAVRRPGWYGHCI